MSSATGGLGGPPLNHMIHTILFFPFSIHLSELDLLICCLTRQLFEAIKPPLGLMMVILTCFPSPSHLFVVRTIVFCTGLYPVLDVSQI